MRTQLLSPDDQLLARLQAPPDLGEGIEALAYWTERRRKLPRYRIAARREAARMSGTWEQHLRGALVSQRGVPSGLRLSAGLLLGRNLLRRWRRRLVIGVTVLIAAAVAVTPLVASVALLLHAL